MNIWNYRILVCCYFKAILISESNIFVVGFICVNILQKHYLLICCFWIYNTFRWSSLGALLSVCFLPDEAISTWWQGGGQRGGGRLRTQQFQQDAEVHLGTLRGTEQNKARKGPALIFQNYKAWYNSLHKSCSAETKICFSSVSVPFCSGCHNWLLKNR